MSKSTLPAKEPRLAHTEVGQESTKVRTPVSSLTKARLAVRLVMRETGDLIWSTTQGSKGARYKGTNADAAGKVVKQLLRDLGKLEEERARDSSKKPSGPPQ